jgi:hypothetical protein
MEESVMEKEEKIAMGTIVVIIGYIIYLLIML